MLAPLVRKNMARPKKDKTKPTTKDLEKELEVEKLDDEVKVTEVETSTLLVEPIKSLGALGPHKIKIVKERPVVINGRDYTELELADHTTVVLSAEDLTKQRVALE